MPRILPTRVGSTASFGPTFTAALDGRRVGDQMAAILDFMQDGTWRTLGEIEEATRYPQASVSAQLRHLRKPAFGSFQVGKRRRDTGHGTWGLWEYKVLPPAKPLIQPSLFEETNGSQN